MFLLKWCVCAAGPFCRCVTSDHWLYVNVNSRVLFLPSYSLHVCLIFDLHLTVYDLVQVTKDYRLTRVSAPLTYNEFTTASSEGRRDIWTDREKGWDEAEAIDTGQNRAPSWHPTNLTSPFSHQGPLLSFKVYFRSVSYTDINIILGLFTLVKKEKPTKIPSNWSKLTFWCKIIQWNQRLIWI